MALDRDQALALDAADPLRAARDEFVVQPDGLVYLDGNSLGRLPKRTIARLQHVISDEWGRGLIRSWDHWIDLPGQIGDLIARGIVGAQPGEVIMAESTTIAFYKLCVAALDARPGRTTIVTDRDNFPTDRYVLEGLAAQRGLTIRWIDGDPVEGPQPTDVVAALDDDVALLTLSHVAYTSAAIADLGAITALGHQAGALVLWDLSHSGGSVPVELSRHDVDLAVGCTYKYLNGGPGAPAYLYVRDDLQRSLRQPIWGWWGQQDMFEMGQGYDPQPDLRQFLSGTAPVLQLVAAQEGISLSVEVGIDAIRAKGMALTALAVELIDEWMVPLGATLRSPRDPSRRGSHVLVHHRDARRICTDMVASGVVPDFRQPSAIRIGLAPLTTSFADVWDGMRRFADLAAR